MTEPEGPAPKENTSKGTDKASQTSDSKTQVYQRLHGGRTLTSIRVKPELKEALKRFCLANGLSLCHVFEMLVTGYLVGMKQKIDWVNQSPTIELTVVREVKRIRRYAPGEKRVSDNIAVENVGSFEKCAYCDAKSWRIGFVYPERDRCLQVYACQKCWGKVEQTPGFKGYGHL